MVYGTTNGPQDDIGNYVGPCSKRYFGEASLHPRPNLEFRIGCSATQLYPQRKKTSCLPGVEQEEYFLANFTHGSNVTGKIWDQWSQDGPEA